MMTRLKSYFQGDGRSALVKKNALASFFLKGVDGIVYLLIVPATLGFLDKYSYGLWLTINSILVWINSFDIGLGNGLRNCLTRALAEGDYKKSRIYISTTYCLLLVTVAIIFSLFYVGNLFVDWFALFNVDQQVVPGLPQVIMFSFLLFCVSFVLKIIGNIYMSLQLQAVNSLFHAASYLLSLLLILLARWLMPHGSLMVVAIIFSASPCLVYAVATPIAFLWHHPELRPSVGSVRLHGYTRELLNVGISFFAIQVSALVLNSMTNVVISNLFGPAQVTPFNISNRYMAVCMLANSIILAPLWSAVTDAQAKGDMAWIGRALHRVRQMMGLFALVLLALLLISPVVYPLWIGHDVSISFLMTALNAVYVFVIMWSSAHSTILCGLGILRVQLMMNLLQVALFFPLTFGLGRAFGIYGLVAGFLLANLPVAFTNTVQVTKIIDGKALGIWSK